MKHILWSPGLMKREEPVVRVVDNRIFLLGLDKLYRDEMKKYESETLLPCAEAVAGRLNVHPIKVPVEGYYGESEALKRYFFLMRALQGVSGECETQVKDLPEFQLLWDVTNSPMYGQPDRKDKLFPVSRNPLTEALSEVEVKDWQVETLTQRAAQIAIRQDNISLVGLAARARDAVVIAALSETVVLYEEILTYGFEDESQIRYQWKVHPGLEKAANRFIDIFHRFVPGVLPVAEAANAVAYYEAYNDNDFIGRCVRIAQSEDKRQFYHWAIWFQSSPREERIFAVVDFFSDWIWTTQDYRLSKQK